MNKYILLILLLLTGEATAQRVSGVYRLHMGMREGFNMWIVDSAAVRRNVYPEFLYGGNPQRYLSFLKRRYGSIMQSMPRNSNTPSLTNCASVH